MPKSNSKLTVVIVTVALLAILIVLMLTGKNSEPLSTPNQGEREEVNQSSISVEWQWQATNSKSNMSAVDFQDLPFTPESVFRALQAVKLDKDGNVILDHDALLSLDEALERIHNQLDSQSLAVLKQLIKDALPGKAGEQTAELVNNYYHFLQAKQEFSQINEAMADTNNELTEESVQINERLYSELQQLREVHMGSETTQKLFRVSDANAQYMFDSMKLETKTELTPEQRQQRRQEIQETFVSQGINIANWPSRYQAFKVEKNKIVNSDLSETQKQQQLEQLMLASFSQKERDIIAHLNLEKL